MAGHGRPKVPCSSQVGSTFAKTIQQWTPQQYDTMITDTMPNPSLMPSFLQPSAMKTFVARSEDCNPNVAQPTTGDQSKDLQTNVRKSKSPTVSNKRKDTKPNPVETYVTSQDASTQATFTEKIQTYISHNQSTNEAYSLDTATDVQQPWICIGEDLSIQRCYAARSQMDVHKAARLTIRDMKEAGVFSEIRDLENPNPAPLWINFGPVTRTLSDDAYYGLQQGVKQLVAYQKQRGGTYLLEAEEKNWPAILKEYDSF